MLRDRDLLSANQRIHHLDVDIIKGNKPDTKQDPDKRQNIGWDRSTLKVVKTC